LTCAAFFNGTILRFIAIKLFIKNGKLINVAKEFIIEVIIIFV